MKNCTGDAHLTHFLLKIFLSQGTCSDRAAAKLSPHCAASEFEVWRESWKLRAKNPRKAKLWRRSLKHFHIVVNYSLTGSLPHTNTGMSRKLSGRNYKYITNLPVKMYNVWKDKHF